MPTIYLDFPDASLCFIKSDTTAKCSVLTYKAQYLAQGMSSAPAQKMEKDSYEQSL